MGAEEGELALALAVGDALEALADRRDPGEPGARRGAIAEGDRGEGEAGLGEDLGQAGGECLDVGLSLGDELRRGAGEDLVPGLEAGPPQARSSRFWRRAWR